MIRRRIRGRLAIVGRRCPARHVVVVDSDTPAAYCVPGTRRRIVVTTAALQALNGAQLEAVLAHERAHLNGRHDLVIARAATLARAFGRCGCSADGAAANASAPTPASSAPDGPAPHAGRRRRHDRPL